MKGKIVTVNRRAKRNYSIEETFEAGLVLLGTEVKSIRQGGVNLKDAYAKIENGEVYLINCRIAPYKSGNRFNHDPERPRKLLLKKREIKRLIGKITERGYTLIPMKMYINERGIIKIQMGLGKGRSVQDKRRLIQERDIQRDMEREMRLY